MARTKFDFTVVLEKDGHKVTVSASTKEELDTIVSQYEAKGYTK